MPALDGLEEGGIVFEIIDLEQDMITREIRIRYRIRIKSKDGWTEFKGITKVHDPVVVTAQDIHDGHANKGGRSGEATGN